MKKKSIVLIIFILINCVGFTKPINQSEIKEENLLFYIYSYATLDDFYKTIDEFNESNVVDIIVKGTITDIDYIYDNQLSKTILTVKVLKSYKDNCNKDIKVYEDGGYIRLNDILDEFNKKEIDLDKKLTKNQIENGLVENIFCNAPHSKIGDQVILYLHENEDSYYLPSSYGIVSCVYGKFTLDKNRKEYIRTKGDMVFDFETSIRKDEMEKKLKDKSKSTSN